MMVLKTLGRWRGSGVATVLLGAMLLAVLTADNPLPADAEAKTPALPPDLAKVPSDAILVASLRFADLWNSDVAKSVRQKLAKEINQGAGEFEKKFGLPLDQVERFTAVVQNVRGPAEPLLFVGTTKPYDKSKVTGGAKAKEEKHKGQTFFVKDNMAVYPLGDRAVVFGNPNEIRSLIEQPAKSDGNLSTALPLAAAKHTAVIALNVQAANEQVGEQLPGELDPFKPMLKARYGTLIVDVGAEMRADVKLVFANEKQAKAAATPARTGLDLARGQFEFAIEQLTMSKQKGMSKFVEMLKQVQASLKAAKIEQDGTTLQASARLKVDVAIVGGLVIDAVQKMREAAARSQGQNNLRQIAIAMHNYHDVNGRFPPQATYDKNGKPLLSWRVLILPYIEQQSVYNQFHLDEPWDSEHNKKVLNTHIIKTYLSPLQDDKSVKDRATHYQGFVGKGAIFDGKQGIRITDITDGTSNTIMIVEASKAVPWSKPEDIAFDPAKELPKLGIPGADSFNAAMCDGSVRTISHKISMDTLKHAITRDGGEVLGNDF